MITQFNIHFGMKPWIILLLCLECNSFYAQNIMSPREYFGHYGTQHSFHHEIIEYIQYLDSNSDMISLQKTGISNQGRPMYLVYVSTPDNINHIEEIRLTNLYNAGMVTNKPSVPIEKVIVWCSFGVHGNEAGTSETVPNLLYSLIVNSDTKAQEWLQNTFVIIDPSLNPDGYDRYVHFLRSTSGNLLHPALNHREHIEPWPTGRYNHYLFDMNRDWAWQTQKESQERIIAYNQWLPHIHADFHEMGYNANYYFAPAAQPYHQYLSDFQRQFQIEIGKNHASYFDKNGWLYWTREVFDLLYPSYGDTYPCFSGAIGMTYEMAGNSSSGRSVSLANGDTLTIQDKIDHNTIVGLSTIEISSKNAGKIIDNFKQYFKESRERPNGKYKSYIFKHSPSLSRLASFFDRNGITYSYAKANTKSSAYHFQTKKIQSYTIEAGDMVIECGQSRSKLLQVLMDESPVLTDSVTYDITAWALPFVFQTDCYAYTVPVTIETSNQAKQITFPSPNSKAFSYQIPWNDLNSAKILADLHQKDYKVRIAVRPTAVQGAIIDKGSLMINKADNPRKNNFDAEIQSLIDKHKISGTKALTTGFSDAGGDLGGSYFQLITAPKVLTFAGKGVSPTSVGEIWYYFDHLLRYPVSIVEWDQVDRIQLNEFNTIVLPDGYYQINEERYQKLLEWTKQGGRLIAIEGALQQFEGRKELAFEVFATEDDKKAAQESKAKQDLIDRINDFEGLERRSISKGTAGAIIKNEVDDTHPLAYGLGKTYYSLKTSPTTYALQKGMWNIIRIPKDYTSYGFIGKTLQPKLNETVSFAAQSSGKGQIIYMVDNPLFRCFWDKGILLFSNAIFLNGSIPDNY